MSLTLRTIGSPNIVSSFSQPVTTPILIDKSSSSTDEKIKENKKKFFSSSKSLRNFNSHPSFSSIKSEESSSLLINETPSDYFLPNEFFNELLDQEEKKISQTSTGKKKKKFAQQMVGIEYLKQKIVNNEIRFQAPDNKDLKVIKNMKKDLAKDAAKEIIEIIKQTKFSKKEEKEEIRFQTPDNKDSEVIEKTKKEFAKDAAKLPKKEERLEKKINEIINKCENETKKLQKKIKIYYNFIEKLDSIFEKTLEESRNFDEEQIQKHTESLKSIIPLIEDALPDIYTTQFNLLRQLSNISLNIDVFNLQSPFLTEFYSRELSRLEDYIEAHKEYTKKFESPDEKKEINLEGKIFKHQERIKLIREIRIMAFFLAKINPTKDAVIKAAEPELEKLVKKYALATEEYMPDYYILVKDLLMPKKIK